MKIKRFLIVIEKTPSGFSAYSPDLDGCVATGVTKNEVEEEMAQAIKFHLDGLEEEGYEIPEPKSYSTYLDVEAA